MEEGERKKKRRQHFFSKPDPCQSPEGYRRSHRLSLQPGQKMSNYLKFLQELAIRQVVIPSPNLKLKFCCQASGGSMASQLFSTAVISGSSSVPNLGAGGGACPESESPSDPSAKACLTLCHLVSHDSNHYDSQVIPWVMISVIMPHAPFSSRRSSVAGSPVQSSGNRGSVAFHTAPLGK